jgi:hypothetical protein
MKLTKQGVRDLNPPGRSNPPRRSFHRHFFNGPLVVIGYRNTPYDWFGNMEADPIYARCCLICGEPEGTR